MGGAGSQFFVMTMTGHERAAATLLVLTAVANAVLGAILIQFFAMKGAAVANTIMLIVLNTAMASYIWRKAYLAPGLVALIRGNYILRKRSVGRPDIPPGLQEKFLARSPPGSSVSINHQVGLTGGFRSALEPSNDP